MRTMLTIWKRELQTLFLSPIAYVTIALFLSMSGWTFFYALNGKQGGEEPLMAIFLVSVGIWLPILVTVVCMRLFAEERRSGTLESLLSTPVSDWSIVAGKYAGAMTILLAAQAPAFLTLFYLDRASSEPLLPPLGTILGGGIMLIMLTALCAAIGILTSLLSSSQITAAIACFAAVCVPFIIQPLAGGIPFIDDKWLQRIAIEHHMIITIRGIIPFWLLWLYGSLTGFFLFTTTRVLSSRRWLG